MLVDDFDSEQARQQLAAIARERAAALKPEGQARALEWISLALEKWKVEQANPDGMIDVPEAPAGLLGLTNTARRRVPCSELIPEECGGPDRCAVDLLLRLHSERYPAVIGITEKLPLDLLVALLLTRDYKQMSMSALAFAVRFIWAITDGVRRIHANAIGESQTRLNQQRSDALAEAFLTKSRNSRIREDTIERLGVEYFQAHRDATNADAAEYIYAMVKSSKEFSAMTQKGIKRKLAGTRRRAIALLPAKSK